MRLMQWRPQYYLSKTLSNLLSKQETPSSNKTRKVASHSKSNKSHPSSQSPPSAHGEIRNHSKFIKSTARLEHIENMLEELKESSTKTQPKTFAQAVSQPDSRAVQRAERRKQGQILRQERAKYEVTLTAAAAPDETKNLLAALHEKEI